MILFAAGTVREIAFISRLYFSVICTQVEFKLKAHINLFHLQLSFLLLAGSLPTIYLHVARAVY